MNDALKVGDIVCLKSGGPKMTVTAVSEDGNDISVRWSAPPFEYINNDTLPAVALVVAPTT